MGCFEYVSESSGSTVCGQFIDNPNVQFYVHFSIFGFVCLSGHPQADLRCRLSHIDSF